MKRVTEPLDTCTLQSGDRFTNAAGSLMVIDSVISRRTNFHWERLFGKPVKQPKQSYVINTFFSKYIADMGLTKVENA